MELLNVAIFRSWPEKEGTSASDIVHGCDKEEVRAHFIGWEDEVQQIIEVRSNTHTLLCDVICDITSDIAVPSITNKMGHQRTEWFTYLRT